MNTVARPHHIARPLSLIALLMLGLMACNSANTADDAQASTAAAAENGQDSRTGDLDGVIRPGEVFGVEIQTPVAFLDSNRFTRGVLHTGEGDFDVYWVEGDSYDNSLGFVLPMDFVDLGEVVHQMVVLSPKLKTPEFVGAGSTLGDLRKAYPQLSVHGSEIEGYTFASVPNYDFKLDLYDMRPEIPAEELDDNVKVLEVWVQ